MEKNKVVTVITVVLILAIACGIIYFKGFQGATIQDLPSEKVAKWIGENSVLYVQPGCSHCEDQERLFGDSIRYLTMIDCLENRQECIDAEVEGTPTWIIDGQKYVGVQSIEKLKELTGYQE